MWRTFSISFTTAMLAGFAFLLFSLIGCPGGGAKLQRVDADFNAIGSSLKTYRLNTGHYPGTEQGLEALVMQPVTDPPLQGWRKIADRVPADPWNNEYRYRLLPEEDNHGFELLSAGQDGQFRTEDDLSSLDPKP
jgi:general secretion pathway protein G